MTETERLDVAWRECWWREHDGDDPNPPARPAWWRPGLLTDEDADNRPVQFKRIR
jgi:hypothetical protein